MGWGLPREGVGAKKFGMSLKTQGNQTFGRDISGFLLGCPAQVPEKFERKSLCSIFAPYAREKSPFAKRGRNSKKQGFETLDVSVRAI